MQNRLLSIRVAGMAVLALCVVHSVAAEDLSCRITLVLNDAVLQQRTADSTAAPKSLVLDLTAVDGQFDRVWGFAESFNKAEHSGNVTDASLAPDRMKLKVRMRIESDAWIKGGRATYHLDLVRSGEKLTGRFTGRWNGLWTQKDIAGEATGTISPLPPIPANIIPPQSGEHPRLLFRKADIPALREKIKSGVGQVAYEHLQRSTHPLALGVMYQLTGDVKYAVAAIKPTQDKMNEKGNGYLNLGHEWGERIKTVAYAYDLCCDAWAAQAPEFKKKVELHLYYMGERSLVRMNMLSQYPNMDFGSSYSAHIRSGGAIASLALWGEKGPPFQEPRNPGSAPVAFTPPADFAPADHLSVNDLTSGQMPTRWIYVGPFTDEFDAGQDFLTSLGGTEQAYKSIKPDTEVRVAETASRFRPTNPATYYQGGIDLMAAFDKKMESTGYFFTAVKVAAPTLVRFTGPNTTWIGSRRIYSGDYLRLAPGTYPLLVRSRLPSINPWGKLPVTPTFTIATPEEAQKDLAIRQAEYKEALLDYRFDMQQWEKSGRIDPRAMAMFQIGRNHAARYYRSVMGDDGFQGEGEEYTLSSCNEFLEYAHCYWRMFGQQVTGQFDVANFAPRYVMPHYGRMRARGLNRACWIAFARQEEA